MGISNAVRRLGAAPIHEQAQSLATKLLGTYLGLEVLQVSMDANGKKLTLYTNRKGNLIERHDKDLANFLAWNPDVLIVVQYGDNIDDYFNLSVREGKIVESHGESASDVANLPALRAHDRFRRRLARLGLPK